VSNLQQAAGLAKGISLNDEVGIFHGTPAPNTGLGFAAPEGSLYLQVGGPLWRKTDIADTAWQEMDVTLLQASAGKPTNVSTTYLDNAFERPSNQVGFVLPYDMRLVAIAAAAQEIETWFAEIHLNEVLVPGAFLSVAGTKTAFQAGYNIQFSAGDELQFFCNGSNVNRPTMTVFMRLN
jgi:hypothetical protein